MQIVIEISSYDKEWITNGYHIPEEINTKIAEAIANGTPLPKGHGRLVDEKEINTVVNGVFTNLDKCSPEIFLNVIHEQCIETIKAD